MRGDGFKILFAEGEYLFRSDVADDNHGGVAGRIAHRKMALQIVDGPMFDVAHPPDDRPLIGVLGNERSGPQLFIENAFVLAIDAGAALAGDYAAFAFDNFGIEAKVAYSVGLNIEDEFRGGTRKPVLIDGDIAGGIGVIGSAIRLHYFIEIVDWGISLRR